MEDLLHLGASRRGTNTSSVVFTSKRTKNVRDHVSGVWLMLSKKTLSFFLFLSKTVVSIAMIDHFYISVFEADISLCAFVTTM